MVSLELEIIMSYGLKLAICLFDANIFSGCQRIEFKKHGIRKRR